MAVDFTKPDSDELEISLFGPGVGEAICMHIGGGKWLLVDSCSNPQSKQPIAKEYLESLGVDLNDSVEFIVVSHWHSDHIQGISELVSICENAIIVTSSALIEKEFATLINLGTNDGSEELPAGLKEMQKVFSTMMDRAKDKTKQFPLKFVNGDQCILNTPSVTISSLSPSDTAVLQSKMTFSQCLRDLSKAGLMIPPPTQNLNAVALWIESPAGNVLLGADLETHPKDQRIGWGAVVNSKSRSTKEAHIVKIPHHGSITGHCDEVWDKMVSKSPIGLMTAYNRSKLPKSDDIKRLEGLTENLYLTTVGSKKPPKREALVERMMKGSVIDRKVRFSEIGHIQLRLSQAGEVRVELNDVAKKIK